ncbi:MAG: NADH:flavin oxidoreductase/NADH oxidase [Bacteroidales bacterium]|nr:NADH:flavin oxidoreductase/NADH oxidase [Bacteroidales bacterium]
MATINEPLQIKSVTFKNRLGMSPMCQYSAVYGHANDWHFVHYGSRAIGGAGLIIVEATAVVPEGRITPHDLGIWNDDQIEELQRIADFAHQHGAVAGIQIAHAGRKASHNTPDKGGKQLTPSEGGWQTVSASPISFDKGELEPLELSKAEIEIIVQHFSAAATRANKAGFKVLEIHAAHGYLMHQFLSPLSNKRTDEYGGSFENRIRILLEVTEAVQQVWPDEYPLFVRISATDWSEGGWNLEESIKLSRKLKELGVDLIDCSSGGTDVNAKIPVAAGYQVSFAEAIKKTGILTSAVGMITEKDQISTILKEEKADIVLLGRELLRNPYFPIVSTLTTDDSIDWPTQYLRAK